MTKQCPICKRYENTGTIIELWELPDGSFDEMCGMCAWTKYLNIQMNMQVSSNTVLCDGWRDITERPEYYKPILMLIETKVIDTIHEIYIAGYYHTDNIYCESCGGNLGQELDEYKIKAWAYIQRPSFV